MDDDDDEVVSEVAVDLVSPESALFLVQYPVRSAARGEERFVGARFRPKNRMVELATAVDTRSPHHDSQRQDLRRRTLNSGLVQPATNYAVAVKRDGILFLAPLETTLQLRPSFAHVDEEENGDATPKAPKLQAVRRQTARELAAQLSSYAHKRAQQEAEPWKDLTVHHADSREASRLRDSITNLKKKKTAAVMDCSDD
ncbi:hypothetical protein CTAYLR_000624 [Chrysophaeum taylorii]|uniref:Uncharacterized protein n=1 Tax=Chrysophaeum taylorii TaxID=2483200 RepID=A0AAD7U8Q2_9STRA|nr:hypothetical protein CTAYLR_000624 [Chrysophaeum taylorii]